MNLIHSGKQQYKHSVALARASFLGTFIIYNKDKTLFTVNSFYNYLVENGYTTKEKALDGYYTALDNRPIGVYVIEDLEQFSITRLGSSYTIDKSGAKVTDTISGKRRVKYNFE